MCVRVVPILLGYWDGHSPWHFFFIFGTNLVLVQGRDPREWGFNKHCKYYTITSCGGRVAQNSRGDFNADSFIIWDSFSTTTLIATQLWPVTVSLLRQSIGKHGPPLYTHYRHYKQRWRREWGLMERNGQRGQSQEAEYSWGAEIGVRRR